MEENKPFWLEKSLEEMSNDEWEKICCRCGLCCLVKVQDEETDDVFYTRVICHLFDRDKRLCTKYNKRCELVPECLKITPKNIDNISWMPKKCSYRILNETGDLPKWHPLKENDALPKLPNDLVDDIFVDDEDLEDYILDDEDF